MLTANNAIYNATPTTGQTINGNWRNIQNWINFSLHIKGIEAGSNVWVEVSNDPNVLTNGANISAPAAPVLTQYTPTSDNHLSGVPVDTTYFVKNTYVTPNSLNPSGGAPQYTTAGLGETIPSAETSLLVKAGNLLVVQSPAQDAGGVAIGWNTYISRATSTETLQNLEDNAIVAPRQFGQTFILTNYGLSTAGPSLPVSNTSGTANSGFNLTGNLLPPYTVVTGAGTGTGLNQVQVLAVAAVTGPPAVPAMAIINPSGIIWNFIRVCKTGGTTPALTIAYLFGQSA
jgi:hypothetical protein